MLTSLIRRYLSAFIPQQLAQLSLTITTSPLIWVVHGRVWDCVLNLTSCLMSWLSRSTFIYSVVWRALPGVWDISICCDSHIYWSIIIRHQRRNRHIRARSWSWTKTQGIGKHVVRRTETVSFRRHCILWWVQGCDPGRAYVWYVSCGISIDELTCML